MDKRYRRRIVKPGVEYYLTRIKDYYSAAWSSPAAPAVNLIALPGADMGGGLFSDPLKAKAALENYLEDNRTS
jgi:hypothetical protein